MMPGQEGNQGINIFIANPLDFHGETGGHGDLAASETFCRLRNAAVLFRGDLAVSGNHADIEHIPVAFILQTAQPFHPPDLLRRQFSTCGKRLFDHIERSAAL